jgi:threonine aldolase
LWLDNARAANAAAKILAKAAPQRLIYPVEANELFLKVSDSEATGLRGRGFDFYEWGPGQIRFVTSWDSDSKAVEQLAAAIAAL